MLSISEKAIVLNILELALQDHATQKKDENYAFHCPFCHHHKQKLEVDIDTGKWHCWVCNSRGSRIQSLVSKLDSYAAPSQLDSIYGKPRSKKLSGEQKSIIVRLPESYIPLYKTDNLLEYQKEPEFRHAYLYLLSRGLRDYDIYKYKIGYCQSGIYKNRIIIPSYDESGLLNYFVARNFYEDLDIDSYKNPPLSRNIIGFDLFINWNEPITLVEGIFDAISVRDNAIPLFGKFLLKKIKDKILLNSNDINIVLDSDASSSAIKIADFLVKNGNKVKLILLESGDPAEHGYESMKERIQKADYIDWTDLLKMKM